VDRAPGPRTAAAGWAREGGERQLTGSDEQVKVAR